MTRRGFDGARGDTALALLLAVLLAAIWTLRDWPNLSALRLPDTDDAMRLQQIRDWLAGQRFADLSQHRLGMPPGLAMHWSRFADLVPGAIIAASAPVLGRHAAEIVAVIVWPTLLFAAALALIASIGRQLGDGTTARTALIVAAIAYPATTLFLPGRIDHHGFQIVLLLIIVRALIGEPTRRAGAIAGIAACLSLVIGLETTPFLAVAGLIVWIDWLRAPSNARITGFGIALSLSLLLASILFHTDQWSYPACDGFDRIAWRAAQLAALAPMLLALAGRLLVGPARRVIASLVIGGVLAAAIYRIAPDCLNPYGQIDPMLARLWLANVAEAQPLFGAAPAVTIGYVGLMIAGIAAGLWQCRGTPDTGWRIALAFQVTALVLTFVELRGAYTGAMLAAPALAAMIARARKHRIVALAAAWSVSAGVLYPIAADALLSVPKKQLTQNDNAAAPDVCMTTEGLARLAVLPPRRILAPVDLGAYVIAASSQSVVAAPYHRNNAGNAAMYRFFLGRPAAAAAIAQTWHIHYVVLCAGSFDELGPIADDRTRIIGMVRAGVAPAWLTRIGETQTDLLIFKVGLRTDRRFIAVKARHRQIH